MARARTLKQGMALGFGRYRYAIRKGGTDVEALKRKAEAEAKNAAEGRATCWRCLAGVEMGAERCPGCGMADPTGVPF